MKQAVLFFVVLAGIAPVATFAQEPARPSAMSVAPDIAGPVLMVTDLERSLKFYVDGLGLALGGRLPGNPGPGATVTNGKGRSPFILLRQRGGQDQELERGNGLSRIMLSVSDSAVVASRLKAAGYTPTTPNRTGVFFVEDPDGYRYEILQQAARH